MYAILTKTCRHPSAKIIIMKIIKYILLELKAKKEGSLYAIRNKNKAGNLVELLEYLFFEYTRADLIYILENLTIIDEEKDDEVILHGNSRTVCIDLTNLTDIYICSFADYQKFEDSIPYASSEYSFIEKLKQNIFESYKIDRISFLQILGDWHTILDTRPQAVVLYENKEHHIAFQTFEPIEQANQFITQHTKN
jgi:hypothetical protein